MSQSQRRQESELVREIGFRTALLKSTVEVSAGEPDIETGAAEPPESRQVLKRDGRYRSALVSIQQYNSPREHRAT